MGLSIDFTKSTGKIEPMIIGAPLGETGRIRFLEPQAKPRSFCQRSIRHLLFPFDPSIAMGDWRQPHSDIACAYFCASGHSLYEFRIVYRTAEESLGPGPPDLSLPFFSKLTYLHITIIEWINWSELECIPCLTHVRLHLLKRSYWQALEERHMF